MNTIAFLGTEMQQTRMHLLVEALRQKGVRFDLGLSDNEIVLVEVQYHIHFPPDLRALLQYALPVSDKFPNWRRSSEDSIMTRLNAPYEGIYFDIEYNNFWWEAWGARPATLQDALVVAKEALHHIPRLIPLYSHRYIPQEPFLAGNPVFSVVQTDIIYYGNDLVSYFANEFHLAGFESVAAPRHIRFWSELTE